MSISYIGAGTGTTTATIPSHQAGDLILAFSFVDGSNTASTLPAGWTAIANAGANTCAGRIAYKIAASSGETSGTWTSATSLVILVYRSTVPLSIGANATNTGSATSINYPALTLQKADGTSWVVGFAGHRSTNTSLETPPTGMTNRADTVDATDEAAGHDTNGGVSSWSSTNVAAGGTASGYRSYVVEIREARIGALSFSGALTASLAADVTSPLRDGYRITQASDRRVTEAGDSRLTEHFVPASFSFVGPGGSVFLAARRQYAVFGFNGDSTASWTAIKFKASGVGWTADSAASFDVGGSSDGAIDWVSDSSLSIAGKATRPSTFGWFSDGAYFSAAGFTREVGLDWVAVGSFAPGGGLKKVSAFGFVADATLTAEAKMIHNAAFDFKADSNIGERILEDGRRRITEAGDVRVTTFRAFVAGKLFLGSFSIAGNSTANLDGEVEITISNVDVHYGGVWLDQAETYVRDGGEWKQAIKIYAHEGGIWKLTR